MKKSIKFILALCALMPLAFISCQPEDIDDSEEIVSVCEHDNLIYVEPVCPTYSTNGCIEHYVCPKCQATFLDPDGYYPVNNTILWAWGYTPWQDQYYEYFNQDEYLDFADQMAQMQNLFSGYANFDFGSFMLSRLLTKFFNDIESMIGSFLDDEGNVPTFEQEVLESLSRIESQLDQMLRQMHEQTYREAMDARNQDVLAAYNETNAKFLTILNVAGKTPLNQLTPEQYNSIVHMLDQWYDHGFLGGTGLGSTKSLLGRYIARYSANGKSYPEIYDEFAYFTYPWEHQGYAFRIACRLVDQMVIAEVYEMSCLYLYFHRDEMPEAQRELDELYVIMTQYGATLDEHKVVKHDDLRICQVPGPAQNKKFVKQLRTLDLYNYVDQHRDERWESYTHQPEEFKQTVDNMLLKTADVSNTDDYVSLDVYKAIYQFYNRDGQKKTMKECLAAADFDNVVDKAFYVPCSNREYWFNGSQGNRYKSFEKDAHKNKYYFGMQCLKDDCNGTQRKDFATNIRIENKHCRITDMGQNTGNVFQIMRVAKDE